MNPTAANEAGLRPEEFAEAAEAALADAAAHPLRDAARVLAQAGLIGVAAAESDGGLGLPLAFAVPIAEAAGRTQARFPLVEQMLLAQAFAGTPAAGAVTAGERIGVIAWQGSLVEGLAGPVRHADLADWVLVPDRDGGAALLECAGLASQADASLDPEQPQAWFDLAGARVVARLDTAAVVRLTRAAHVLLAAFVTGAAQGAIRRTATQVATRVQFGRPLSAKQAVRHWMARMQLAAEVSAAATQRVLADDEFGDPRDPRPALVGALANATFVLEKAIHLHGGMGFTWEMPLHRSLRDVRAIDAALGGGAFVEAVGRALAGTDSCDTDAAERPGEPR